MNVSSPNSIFMPSSTAEHLHHSLPGLMGTSVAEGTRLSHDSYQKILIYCGIRPDIMGWRHFFIVLLTLLGLLALVSGSLFFIAWNWALMPKMAKFALIELLIIALATLVWWRWYDLLARMALLATGLSFGGLFALYGQVYQTGADNWELFRAWALVLLPLALIGRQNTLWFCTWVVANLAFQLYKWDQILFFSTDILWDYFSWPYAYLGVQILCLITREALAEYASRQQTTSWLSHRWFSRVIAAYLLLQLTLLVAGWQDSFFSTTMTIWAVILIVGYFYYRYRRPDLCMLTLGVISVIVVGGTSIIQLLDPSWHFEDLFSVGFLIALWLASGGALLLYLRRQLSHREEVVLTQNAMVDLLKALHRHHLLNDEQVLALKESDHSTSLPWYLRAALVTGSWVAALISLFLVVLVLFYANLFDSFEKGMLILPSLILAALAAGLLRSQGTGKHHIGLAWAIAATCGFCASAYLLVSPNGGSSFASTALWCLPILAIIAVLMLDQTYRFLAVTAFVFILITAFSYLAYVHLSPNVALGAISLLVASIQALWLWVISIQDREPTAAHKQLIVALLYGIPTGLALLCSANLNSEVVYNILGNLYLSQALGWGIAAGLMTGALIQAVGRSSASTRVYLPAAIVCGAIALFAPGIGFGMVLLLAARHQGSKVLLGVAGCFLILYLSHWYYFLGVTLLYKSLLLLVSGSLLLVLAVMAKKLLPAETGRVNHAK